MRELALQILLTLNAGRGRARDMLNKTIREMQLVDPDKSLLTEIVYGTIRWRGNLDWIIAQFIHPRKLKKIKPEIIEIIRLGLYQLLFLNSIPDHAAVNESVELAKGYGYKGTSGLVNAVLRQVTRSRDRLYYPDIRANPVAHIATKYSHPEWLVKRWLERYGVDETIQLCSANNQRAPLCIRTNMLKASREELMKSLEREGATVFASKNLPESVEIISLPSSLNQLTSYRQGWFQVQDESSMLASHILDPQPDEIIIDACAAPGGKTTHIAELMRNTGKVLAFDIDSQRLKLISETCGRLGIMIVEVMESDARNLDEHIKADRVIADVPCTGLGVLRRRIETRWHRTPEDVRMFPELQYAILENSARHVKSGGILVYCTCTTEPEENQQVVEIFLSAHPEFRIQSVLPFLPEQLKQAEKLVSPEGYMQTFPHLHNMDGFFAVRMVKS